MKKLVGRTKIDILKKLEEYGGEFEKPSGGWWAFFCRFGHYNAYANYFYKHLRELIRDGYVEETVDKLILTEKGRELLSSVIREVDYCRVLVEV